MKRARTRRTAYALIAPVLALPAVCAALPPDAAVAAAYRIERLEPPFWWPGFVENRLQLLLYGPNVSELTPSVDYPGVSISRIERVDSANYLFVYLDLTAQAPPGELTLQLSGPAGKISQPYRLLRRRADPQPGFSSSDAIYLITPDRFANGDPDNDELPGFDDRVDRGRPDARHGGDIAGIIEHLDYIADMGFTALWLNPVLENAMPSHSYHGYATTDFYRVDPRFGSTELYRELVDAARAEGIGVIMDMIVNHCGSRHWWMADLPSQDWINFPDRYVETSHQRTTWQDPHASDYDLKRFADGWFAPTMPDLNQRNPLLADYLIQNALWWIEYLGLAGIRMDTYPYPDKHFMTRWTQRVMAEYPAFNVVGEEWSPNPAIVSYWQRGKVNSDGYVSHLPSLMDFPLQAALIGALTAGEADYAGSWTPAYQMLANDFLYADPGALVVFADNHDMSRIFTQLGEDYDLFRMAIVYVLTMRGTPQLYYGTELLLANPGSTAHGVIRADFPGGWRGDDVDGFTGRGLTARQREAQAFVRRMLNWRKGREVVHSGRLMQFAPSGGIYAYARYDEDDTIIVIFNKGDRAGSVAAGQFAERIGHAGHARDVLSGRRIEIRDRIEVPARSVMVLEIENQRGD